MPTTEPTWPEPERCPYHSRAWGCRCDYPAGHTKESVGYDDCNSAGDGFASGYNPWVEPDGHGSGSLRFPTERRKTKA